MNDTRLDEVVRGFLRYSFEDINFDYEQLTPREKAICSATEFEQLRKLVDGKFHIAKDRLP